MISTSPEFRYLKNVLGLEAFVRPISDVLVIVERVLSPEESELLKKMLSSIKVSSYEVIEGAHEQALSEKLQKVVGVVLVCGSSSNSSVRDGLTEKTKLPLATIQDFYLMAASETHPAEVAAYKKAAWAELQNFKRQI